jgi:branched-chain amino acid transport system substrate-binding protein
MTGLVRAGLPALLAGVLLFAAAGTAVGTGTQEPPGDEIVIGFFGPLSGENAQYGRNFRNAIDLYTDNVNEAGGINGLPIRVIYEDDRADPREAANIAQRYASDPSVIATIGSFSTAAAMAAAPVLEETGLVQISPTSSHPDFTLQGDYMFRIVTTQDIEAPLGARFVHDRLGAQRIALIYRQDDWGVVVNEHFARGAQDLGAELVMREAVVPETRDFRPLVTRLSELQPDAIYLALFYADAAVLAQQMHQAGLAIPVITNTSLFNPQLIELAGEAVEGYYVPSNFAPQDPAPAVSNFVTRYEARFGSPPDQFAALAYDAIGSLVTALEAATSGGSVPSRAAVRDALAAIDRYTGVTGELEFDEYGNALRSDMTWLRIDNGSFRVLDD